MRHPIIQNRIHKRNLGSIHPRTAIRQHRKHQVLVRHTLHRYITQARREDDVFGYDVVFQHRLQRLFVCGGENGSDIFKRCVIRDENCKVGDVQPDLIGPVEPKVDGELGCLECAVHGGVASAVGEELEGGAKGKYRINLMNRNAFAEFDILVPTISSPFIPPIFHTRFTQFKFGGK